MHAMHRKKLTAMFLNSNHLQKRQGKLTMRTIGKTQSGRHSLLKSDWRTDEKNTSRATENVNNLTNKINPKIRSKPCSQQREFIFFFFFF